VPFQREVRRFSVGARNWHALCIVLDEPAQIVPVQRKHREG
jgi:hypothetical protein